MTNSTKPSNPIHPVQPIFPAGTPDRSAAPSPERRWLTEGETMNPGPRTQTPRTHVKDTRDTALGCRDRATADLVQSLAATTANGRRVLETSAASWGARAELLQRIETGIEARLAAGDPDAVKLTSAEIAEDAAQLRL